MKLYEYFVQLSPIVRVAARGRSRGVERWRGVDGILFRASDNKSYPLGVKFESRDKNELIFKLSKIDLYFLLALFNIITLEH